jgi:type VI secretion system ImpJ/VasE family protein
MSMKIHWQEGLFLQPHHLQRMQKGVEDELASERRLTWPYPSGVIEARLNRAALANKRVAFDRLRAIMPSGLEINHPGSAELPSLDVAQVFSRGSGSFVVNLAVPLWQNNRANTVAHSGDTRAKLLYRVGETECYDENTGENPKPIQIRKINARLMLAQEDTTEMEVLPLIRVVRATGDDSGLPKEDPEFVPPCMLLHGSAVLRDMVRDIINEVEAARKEAATQIYRGSLKFESISRGTEYEQVFRLQALNRHSARLRPLFDAPSVSPFMMFVALRELLADLAALKLGVDPFESEPYQHESQFLAFRDLTNKIRELLKAQVLGSYEKVVFKDEGGVQTARFKDEHFAPGCSYYLGIKTEKIEPAALIAYAQDGDKFKLMPLSMHNKAFRGIELKEERVAPMGLPALGIQYFRLERANSVRRWQDLQTEKAAAIVWMGRDHDWSGASFTLYIIKPN